MKSDRKRRKLDTPESDSVPVKQVAKPKSKLKSGTDVKALASQADSDDDDVPLAAVLKGKKPSGASRQGTVGFYVCLKE